MIRPIVGAGEPYTFPSPMVSKLANGLEIWIFQMAGQHVISAELSVPVPLNAEPIDGINQVTLASLDTGTINHPNTQLVESLEAQGASFSGSIKRSAAQIGLSVPTTRVAKALKLFAEIITQPSLTFKNIATQMALHESALARMQNNSSHLAWEAFARAVFADEDRSSRPLMGTIEDLHRMTPQDVRDFFAKYWTPTNAVLAIAGDFPAAFGDEIAYFESWLPRTPAQISEPIKRNTQRKIWLIDRPNAVAADVRIGGFGIDRLSPLWPAFQVAACSVGGSFMSRLNTVLREKLGYTYGAHFVAAPLQSGGTFTALASFRTEVVAKAVAKTLEILDISAAPLSEDEVADAKNYLISAAPLIFDSAGAIANTAANLAGVGLTAAYLNDNARAVSKVSADEANEAFTSIVKPSDCHITICGKADVIEPELCAQGFSVEIFR